MLLSVQDLVGVIEAKAEVTPVRQMAKESGRFYSRARNAVLLLVPGVIRAHNASFPLTRVT